MTPPNPAIQLQETDGFRLGMRRLAASVAVIAAGRAGCRRGLTATAVCSVSADPPTLAICVNKSASAHEAIIGSGSFSVNILSADQSEVANAFGGAIPGPERFKVGKWSTGGSGNPVLTDALASFECDLEQRIDASTHDIFIGSVRSVGLGGSEDPLLYHGRKYRRLA